MSTPDISAGLGQVVIGAITGIALGSLMMASLAILSRQLQYQAQLTLPVLFVARFILIGLVLWWLATLGPVALITSVVCLLAVRIWVLKRCIESL